MKLRLCLLVTATLALLLSPGLRHEGRPMAISSADAATTSPCRGAAKPARWHHVVWIWMENKSYSQIIGSPDAPYINSLAKRCGLATDDHGVAYPSLPNYLAATSGSTHGVTDDGSPQAHQVGGASIFSQVNGWRSLAESMPVGCDLQDAYPYMVKHNPAAYYPAIRTQCKSQDFALASRPSFAAPFTFITPNMCHDIHDCSTRTGDGWLSQFIPKVLASPQYAAGDTLLVLTFDSDNRKESNRIATVLAARSIRSGTRSGTHYTHYSLLRTTEELLGRPLLGNAATATSMRQGFGL